LGTAEDVKLHRVKALRATATHHHFEPRMAAIIVNGPPARKTPNTQNLPNGESGNRSAIPGTTTAAQ